VILAARSIDKLEALCQELVQWGKDNSLDNPHAPAYRYLDVTELNGGDDGFAQIRELATYAIDGKTIHVLVNCAGQSSRGSIMETPLTVYRRIMEVWNIVLGNGLVIIIAPNNFY
jgi:short-subunit dehydrogenase